MSECELLLLPLEQLCVLRRELREENRSRWGETCDVRGRKDDGLTGVLWWVGWIRKIARRSINVRYIRLKW